MQLGRFRRSGREPDDEIGIFRPAKLSAPVMGNLLLEDSKAGVAGLRDVHPEDDASKKQEDGLVYVLARAGPEGGRRNPTYHNSEGEDIGRLVDGALDVSLG